MQVMDKENPSQAGSGKRIMIVTPASGVEIKSKVPPCPFTTIS
jgi:hypothetical protein